MNRVGLQGRGESVWLGWFLCSLVNDWAPIARVGTTRGHNAGTPRRVVGARRCMALHGTAKWSCGRSSTTAHRSGPT